MYVYFFTFSMLIIDEKQGMDDYFQSIGLFKTIITFSLQSPEGITHNWQIPS